MRLNVRAFALTCGILWGLWWFLLLLTLWMIAADGTATELSVNGKTFLTYAMSPLGSLLGLFVGFIDGVIAGALFAWLYNWFAGKPVTSGADAGHILSPAP